MDINTKLFLIGVLMLIPVIYFYPKISYGAFYKRCVENSKHPDWTPFCGKNFLKGVRK